MGSLQQILLFYPLQEQHDLSLFLLSILRLCKYDTYIHMDLFSRVFDNFSIEMGCLVGSFLSDVFLLTFPVPQCPIVEITQQTSCAKGAQSMKLPRGPPLQLLRKIAAPDLWSGGFVLSIT